MVQTGQEGTVNAETDDLTPAPIPVRQIGKCVSLSLESRNSGKTWFNLFETGQFFPAQRQSRPRATCNLHSQSSTAIVSAGPWCQRECMTIQVRAARAFDDVKTMLGPKRPDANVCWCLSYRISSKDNIALWGTERGQLMERLCAQDPPPGVLAYDGDVVVGWAAVHPRAGTSFAGNRKIPHVDDVDVWAVWCIRVRPGHRGKGISHHLLTGAVEFARDHGAPAIEGYPVDNEGKKVDLTMAYVGTRKLFERAGFIKAADTDSVLNGFPRVLMRLDLR